MYLIWDEWVRGDIFACPCAGRAVEKNKVSLDLVALQRGLYLVKIKTLVNGKFISKLVKQ